MNELEKLISEGKITLTDICNAVNNHETRQTTERHLLEIMVCENCKQEFLVHPHAKLRLTKYELTPYCHRRPCRQKLKAFQNSEFFRKLRERYEKDSTKPERVE